nr:LysR family transcriptional regulator [Brucella pituitosa]
MELRSLETFLAVMSTGSITGAAKLLGRSQSQVTRLIQELEVTLGFSLFERNGPRIAPTIKGIAFHVDVERLVSGLGQLRERANTIARSEAEPIEIAATSAFATGIIPKALAKMQEIELPRTVHLRSMAAEAAVQAVLARSSDFCVTSLPAELPGLTAHGLFQGSCVAAVSTSDPLAAKEVISIKDLVSRTLITTANPYRLRGRVNHALESADVQVGRIIDTNVAISAMQIASTGLGVAIVEPATGYFLQTPNVVVRPLDADIPFFWGIFSATARPLSECTRALIDQIIATARAQTPGFVDYDPAQSEHVAQTMFEAKSNRFLSSFTAPGSNPD